MQSETMIALSAATGGVAIAGVVSALRAADAGNARAYLIALFVLFGGVAAIPLVVVFARGLYVFYMPAVLPMLLALPSVVYHYVAARSAGRAPVPIHWRDGVLPVAGVLTTFGYWLLSMPAKSAMFIDGVLPPGFAPSALAFATFALIFLWALASLGYLVATLHRLAAFRKRLKDLYSNTDQRELRWVEWLMTFLVAVWVAAAVSLVSDNFGPGLLFPGEVVFLLTAILLLFVIAFVSVTPSVETPNEAGAAAASEEAPDQQTEAKYARSALSEDHAKRIIQRIENAMREEALYLEPNLSLNRLSRHVGAPTNLVSQTLNDEIGSTFFDYIAHWRIEAAKPLILLGEASVSAIALEVGFNSRSTFYKAFKRETGLTPKAFRENNELPRPPNLPTKRQG